MGHALGYVALLATLCVLRAAPTAASSSSAPAPSFAGAAVVAAEEARLHPMRPEANTPEGPSDAVWPAAAPRTTRSEGLASAPGPSAAPRTDVAQAFQARLIREASPAVDPDVGIIPARTADDYSQALGPLEALLKLGGQAVMASAEQAAPNVTVTDVASQHPPLQVRWPGQLVHG